MSLSIICTKNKNRINNCPEFPIEWTIIYHYEKSQLDTNSQDMKLAGGVRKSLERPYTAALDSYATKGKCIAEK